MTFAVINGTADASVPLDPAAVATIGALQDGSGELLCSGLLIAERWVLTAKHCIFDAVFADSLFFRTESAGAPVLVPVTARFPHPSADALLLEIPPSSSLSGAAIRPFDLGDIAVDSVGRKAIISGLGRTADGSYGTRQFVDTTIAEVQVRSIVVDSGPEHGACGGDSGGPLITIADDGSASVVGILEQGSESCRGTDVYTRVDQLRAWIAETQQERLADPCGGVTWEGICHDGQLPTWCAGDHLEMSTCVNHQLCGWDTGAQGYRCVDGDSDPCFGAGPEGYCVNDTLRRCSRGRLFEVDCRICGQACFEAQGGGAKCSP